MPASATYTIGTAFKKAALDFPDKIAIVTADESLTYTQLAARVACIAHNLGTRNIVAGDVVGLSAARSSATIATILSLLASGIIVAPLDAQCASALRQRIVADCQPKLVITDANDSIVWPCETISVEALLEGKNETLIADDVKVKPDDAACILYTSGSTGSPKGVLIPHRAIVRLVINNNYAQLDASQTFLQLAPLSFDASLFEIWGALLNGGTLAIAPSGQLSVHQIAKAIRDHNVTTLWLTAGVFNLMIEHYIEGLKPLKQLLTGGDVLSPPHVQRALQALTCTLINGYGPTENTTFSTCYTIPPGFPEDQPIPIGTAIAGTSVHVLDADLKPIAADEQGELFLGGTGLALGYWQRSEATAAQFINHVTLGRLYHTGDCVRFRADGNLDFLGRRDRQIKISGKRVELDEVEVCLRRSGLVVDAAVLVDTQPTQKRIVAFFTPRGGSNLDALHAYIREQLPEHMRPAQITSLDAMPLTTSGKIDRVQLSALLTSMSRTPVGRTAPLNTTETLLLELWQAILGCPAIGLEENFFDVGGASLQLVELHAAMTSKLQCTLAITELFRLPTIASQAAAIVSHGSLATTSITAPARDRAPQLAHPDRTRLQHAALQRAKLRAQTLR